jgi:hypothetical protein
MKAAEGRERVGWRKSQKTAKDDGDHRRRRGERGRERESELFSPLARPPAAAAVKTRWLRMVVAAAAAAGSAAAVPEDFFLE